jgi:hypothetical protein
LKKAKRQLKLLRLSFPTYSKKKESALSMAPSPPQISGGANRQTESPLFSTIPAEIRQKIYTFTLRSFDDPSKPFNPEHHHYRPGHEYRQTHDLRLLQTCKRIYHEARLLPVSLNEVVIYLYRGPRSQSQGQYDWRVRDRILSQDQRDSVHTVQIFAQQWYLESSPNLLGYDDSNPSFGESDCRTCMTAKKIILTLRRSDWWSWESPPKSNDQLGICPWRLGRTDWKQMEAEPLEGPPETGVWLGWGSQFAYVRGLETLEMEFEAVAAKKAQLERVVARAKHWRFPLRGGRVLAWTGEVKVATWEGALLLKEDGGVRPVRLRSIRPHRGQVEPPLKCTYMVMTMRWRVAKREHAD